MWPQLLDNTAADGLPGNMCSKVLKSVQLLLASSWRSFENLNLSSPSSPTVDSPSIMAGGDVVVVAVLLSTLSVGGNFQQ